MDKLNYWENFDLDHIASLRNTVRPWSATDNEDEYAKVVKSNVQTYTKEDFDYRYNSHGFRSEEFNQDDPIKILYGGCSLTEGVGLSRDHIWGSFINSRISQDIGKDINFYNIGVGGLSIEAIIRYTYITINNGYFTPDVVCMLFPGIFRNELMFEHPNGLISLYHFIPNVEHSGYELRRFHDLYARLTSARQRFHEIFRSLLFLKTFLDSKGIPFFFSTWDNFRFSMPDTNGAKMVTPTEVFVNYGPNALKGHFIPALFIFDHDAHNSMFDKRFPYIIGRDGMHPGPNAHWNYSKTFYEMLKQKDDFKRLLEKWKTN